MIQVNPEKKESVELPQGDSSKKKAPSSRSRSGFQKLCLGEEGLEARRLAAVILEVLAGARTPTEAAQAVGVSVPRYYALEERALGGLLSACRPRSKGPGKAPERELVKLKKEIGRLEREYSRSQALLRASQKTVGIRSPDRSKPQKEGKRRSRRSRVARALRAAQALRSKAGGNSVEKGGATGEDESRVKR